MAATGADVTPNRRGARSREAVLDVAERVMAEHGYAGATIARVVDAAGIPASSIYHYFGSKDGMLLAVMERGAERFFAAVPESAQLLGTPEEHMRATVAVLRAALEANPDFLRLLIVIAAQPSLAGADDAGAVVARVRDEARRRLRGQLALVLGSRADAPEVARLATFTLSLIDGAFIAVQSDPTLTLGAVLDLIPAAVIALHAGWPGA